MSVVDGEKGILKTGAAETISIRETEDAYDSVTESESDYEHISAYHPPLRQSPDVLSCSQTNEPVVSPVQAGAQSSMNDEDRPRPVVRISRKRLHRFSLAMQVVQGNTQEVDAQLSLLDHTDISAESYADSYMDLNGSLPSALGDFLDMLENHGDDGGVEQHDPES